MEGGETDFASQFPPRQLDAYSTPLELITGMSFDGLAIDVRRMFVGLPIDVRRALVWCSLSGPLMFVVWTIYYLG